MKSWICVKKLPFILNRFQCWYCFCRVLFFIFLISFLCTSSVFGTETVGAVDTNTGQQQTAGSDTGTGQQQTAGSDANTGQQQTAGSDTGTAGNNETGTKQEEASSSNSGVIETVDTIYQQAENNGIADAICKAIDIGKMFMVPLFAIMFCIYGFRAFQGDGAKWSTFITFAIGMAAFNSAGTFLEWFMPKMGLDYGCKCAIERDIRDTNGAIKTYPTGLNYDCSSGTEDYYSLHGLSNGGMGQKAMSIREEITTLKAIVSSYENLFGEVEALATQMKQKQLEVQEYETAYQNASAIYNAYNGSKTLNAYEGLKSIVEIKNTELATAQQNYDSIELQIKSIDAEINELKNKIAKQEKAVKVAKANYTDAWINLNNNQGDDANDSSILVFQNLVNSAYTTWKQEETILNSYDARLSILLDQKGKTYDFSGLWNELSREDYNQLSHEVSNLLTKIEEKKEEIKVIEEHDEAVTKGIIDAYTMTNTYQQYLNLQSLVTEKENLQKVAQQEYDGLSLQLQEINKNINEVNNNIVKQQKNVELAKEAYDKANSLLLDYQKQENRDPSKEVFFIRQLNSAKEKFDSENAILTNYQTQLENLISQKGGVVDNTNGLKQISQTSYDKLVNDVNTLFNTLEAKKRELKKIQEQEEPTLRQLVETYQTTTTYQQYLTLQSVVTEKNNLQKTAQQEYDAVNLQLQTTNKEITDMQNKIAKQEKAVKSAEKKYYEANNLLLDYQKQDNKVPERETIFIQNRDNAKTTFDKESGLLLDYQNRLEELNIQKTGKQAVLDKDGKVIEKEIIGLEADVAESKNKLDKAKEAYKQAVKNLEGYGTKSEVLAYKNKQSELDKLLEKKTNLQQEIITLDSKYRDKNNELQHSFVKGSTQTNLVGLEADVAESKNKLDKAKEEYKKAVNDYKTYETKSEIQAYKNEQSKFKELMEKKSNLQKELSSLQEEYTSKKALLARSIVAGTKPTTETLGLSGKLKEAGERLNYAKEDYKQAIKNLEEFETKVEMKIYFEAKSNLSNASSNRDKSKTEYNNLLTKWQVKKQKLDSMTNSYTEAKSKIATLQIELAKLTSS